MPRLASQKDFPGHRVKTVRDMKWAGIKNGRLLSLAENEFDVFITGDRNLSFQQNLTNFSIIIIILHAESIQLIHLRPLIPKILNLLSSFQKGTVNIISP